MDVAKPKPGPRPGFVGGTLDRADQIRSDPALLARAFADPRAGVLALDGLDPVVAGDTLAIEPLPSGSDPADFILLGQDDNGPLFVRMNPAAPHAANFSPKVWEVAPHLSANALAIYGTARSLVDWHARHGFCAVCGGETGMHKAGWARKCLDHKGLDCSAEHFPRVDPVTIMLAEYGDKVLIGRQHRWPPGRYSALAGFVEPGETLEEAVARELWEEAGIRVSDVSYVMSQPWPFASSLMVACMAQAVDDRLTLDETEIEDAFWVDAAGVRASLNGDPDAPFLAPPVMAVAHHLFLHWLEKVGG
ncbi:NAD(+) diphosphatase [Sphingobium phenoxybenzoativorans]|uniref:NAD(+) diphosphatase n=1 Tax=Sphingobium phenoxybenzoativorans TaxID=1592790 RepID=UPI001FEBB2AA|nr:NAD(+) diphosphatase [Sphingobium phenoxybenzoativorans]